MEGKLESDQVGLGEGGQYTNKEVSGAAPCSTPCVIMAVDDTGRSEFVLELRVRRSAVMTWWQGTCHQIYWSLQ